MHVFLVATSRLSLIATSSVANQNARYMIAY